MDTLRTVRPYALQIARGLNFLHDHRFVCGDLTLDTITVSWLPILKNSFAENL